MPTIRSDKAMLKALVKHINEQDFEPLTAAIERYLMIRDGHPNRLAEYVIPLLGRPRPPGRFSPSSIGGCARQSVFRFLGVEARIKKAVRTELIFEDGNWRHHKWQAMMRDMQEVLGPDRFRCLAIEQDVSIPSLFIAGALDVRIAIKYKGKWWKYVIDIKGANEYSFRKIFVDRDPHESYIRQIITYCKAVGYDKGLLLFDAKNTQEIMAWPVEITAKGWSDVEEWTEQAIEHLRDRSLPPKHPECVQGNFLYGRCAYAHLCFGPREQPQVRRIAFRGFDNVEAQWERSQSSE